MITKEMLDEIRAVAEMNREQDLRENYYSADYYCLNCAHRERLSIPKGTLICDHECPNCRCTPREVEK